MTDCFLIEIKFVRKVEKDDLQLQKVVRFWVVILSVEQITTFLRFGSWKFCGSWFEIKVQVIYSSIVRRLFCLNNNAEPHDVSPISDNKSRPILCHAAILYYRIINTKVATNFRLRKHFPFWRAINGQPTRQFANSNESILSGQCLNFYHEKSLFKLSNLNYFFNSFFYN